MDELLGLMRQESHLHHPLYPLHPQARLRCSPRVINELMKVILPDNLFASGPRDASTIWGILVTVDATMEPGTWQLIAGEGKV